MEALSEDEQKRFKGSGKTMKIIKVSSIKEINESEIVELRKLVWEKQEANTE